MDMLTSFFGGNNISPEDKKKQTANDFVNVDDIKDSILYTRDGYIFSFIKLTPISIDLLSIDEQRLFVNNLTGALAGERKPFKFFAISQTVDMSKMLSAFYDMLHETDNKVRRELLTKEIQRITGFSMSGNIIERQFFVIIWERLSDENIIQLKERAIDFVDKFQSCNVNAEIQKKNGIFHLIKLFAHPQTGHLDITDNNYEATIPILEGINEKV